VSEYIDNVSQRKETLKHVLEQLHEGKSVEEVKGEFATLVQNATASEIAEVEELLIEEGVPASEIQKLCDVHVAVFRESLDRQEAPETTPGHPVFTYRAENLAAGRILDQLQEALEALHAGEEGALERARERLAKLREYDKHYLRKENILFPYLERHEFTGPSSVMWAIHDEIRDMWKALALLLEEGPGEEREAFLEQVEALFEPLERAIREMFYKEENILFPAALERLSEEEWAAVRAQGDEVGYAYVRPGLQWQPEVEQEEAQAQMPAAGERRPVSGGELPLDVGRLTLEQINLMLTHLPIDLTYVDETDTVRFYSQTKERIFTRTPSVIGRKVQNCHPPQSVHRVQEILDDFRAGRRDQAEFWIQMQGMFIYITYYALRDEEGAYRGTLEVTQEIGHIRSLEGEKRLLDGEAARS
jgi:hypothetical protein